jgi:hypothetical protein
MVNFSESEVSPYPEFANTSSTQVYIFDFCVSMKFTIEHRDKPN